LREELESLFIRVKLEREAERVKRGKYKHGVSRNQSPANSSLGMNQDGFETQE
jgi:hypothetical protein